jgi:hypothetical protein
LTGFSSVWTFICSILKACSAARMAVVGSHFTVDVVVYCWCQFTVVRCCWCPLYRWCCLLLLLPVYRCVLLLMPTLPLFAVANAHFTVVCCCWCPVYRSVLLLMPTLSFVGCGWCPLYRCVLLLMPTFSLFAVADAHFTVVGCCWCPLYRCGLLLMPTLPLYAVAGVPPPAPPFTSFLYQHSQSVDVSRTQGSGAPEILFFWGGVRTYVCMHRPLQLLGLPQKTLIDTEYRLKLLRKQFQRAMRCVVRILFILPVFRIRIPGIKI